VTFKESGSSQVQLLNTGALRSSALRTNEAGDVNEIAKVALDRMVRTEQLSQALNLSENLSFFILRWIVDEKAAL